MMNTTWQGKQLKKSKHAKEKGPGIAPGRGKALTSGFTLFAFLATFFLQAFLCILLHFFLAHSANLRQKRIAGLPRVIRSSVANVRGKQNAAWCEALLSCFHPLKRGYT
ncbi:MAG: hypothetical protein ACJAQ8_000989 [Haliea salexigens]|jgi:hypothetical protein